MSLTLEKLYPPAPFVERGKRVILGSHPRGGALIYPNKNNVIIRDLTDKCDNDVYYGHSYEVRAAKYSPSGFYIASGDKSGKIQIWDTTQKTHILKNEFSVLSTVNDLVWSNDNSKIAIGGQGSEKNAKVINAEMGTEVGELNGMSKAVNALDFKPTRPFRLATGSEDFSVCFFEGPPFKFKKSCTDHTNFVNCCRFSPKGDIFVTAGSDGKIIAFDAASGDKLGDLGSHKSGIYGIDFSPSGARLVSVGGDKKVKLWSTEGATADSFKFVTEYAFDDELNNMQLGCVWMPGKIVTVALSGLMTCFAVSDDCSDLAASTPIYMLGHSRPIKCAAYSPTAERFVSASYDAMMLRWEMTTGVAEVFTGKEAHTSMVHALTVCDDLVISVGVDDRLVFASISNKSYEASIKLDSQPQAVSSSNEGLVLVVCQKHAYLFSVAGGKVPDTHLSQITLTDEPKTGCISPCGSLAVIGQSNGNILFYKIEDGKTLKPLTNMLEKMEGEPSTMSFSPDSSHLAMGDGHRFLRLLKVDITSSGDGSPNMTRVHQWQSHAARVTCIAWSPNSHAFATGGLDCSIMVYKPTSTSKICEVRNAHPANMITALAWKSDNLLFSTGQDAFVRSWVFN